MRRIPLEEAAFKVCEQSSVPPLIFQLPPAKRQKTTGRPAKFPCKYVSCQYSV